MSKLRLGLTQYPITGPRDVRLFWDKIDTILADAAAAGTELLVLPEYASMEVAACYPGAGNAARELAAVADAAPALLAGFRDAANRHGIWLLPGTLPWRTASGTIVNRAPLIAPDGRIAGQEKTVMTRFEAEHWGVCPGAAPRVFETDWGRIGITICYDVEFPPLARAQAQAGVWLILVPTCTDTMHGFNRVRLSARARALENQCFVAMSPTIGTAPHLASVDENHGYAAVFGPVDGAFPEDGVIERGMLDEAGLLYVDLDPASLEPVRQHGAVRNFSDWPAVFDAAPEATLLVQP
jgi:predicted amidohydrolase